MSTGDKALEDQRRIVLALNSLQALHVFVAIRREHFLASIGVRRHAISDDTCQRSLGGESS